MKNALPIGGTGLLGCAIARRLACRPDGCTLPFGLAATPLKAVVPGYLNVKYQNHCAL